MYYKRLSLVLALLFYPESGAMASWVLNRKKTAAPPPPSTAGTVGTKKGPDEKLRAIFQHFDDNDDGYLSYQELRRLQLQTSGDDLDGPTFCALCEEFKCQPSRGLTLDALRATYEDGDGIDGGAEGSASIEEDYDKIFPDGEEDLSGGDSQGEGEEGGDVEDAIFRELMRKEEDKNDPQRAASSNDAKQAKKGGHSKTVWTDVELNGDQSDVHADQVGGSSDMNDFRACNIDTATKVLALHTHFDLDGNKFLNYSELSALQLATSDEHLEGPEYCHLCRENQCDPRKGLSVKALQTIYEESGIDHLDQDYDKVFEGRDPKEVISAATPHKSAVSTATSTSSFGISLPELPSPSYLSNMLFGSGFGGAIAHDSSEVAYGGGMDMAQDDEGEVDADQRIEGEDGDEGDGEESSGLLARISRSPGWSKPLHHVDDHVRTLHKFFDIYNTGRLGYCELRNMQLRTCGNDLDVEEYRMICEELGVDPREGLSVEALQQTYSSGGGNISDDYKKVFPSESVAKLFSSPEVKDLGVNLHGDYPFLAAERLEKISLIFKYFDEDQNGLLSYRELRQLQLQTSGEDMDGPQFSTVCGMYKCDPHDGLTMENLRDIYSSQGVDSSLDDDYRKVYRQYVWSLQKRSNIEKEQVEIKKDPCIETAGSHEEDAKGEKNAAKIKEDEDELTQESGEGSMEKRPLPESSD